MRKIIPAAAACAAVILAAAISLSSDRAAKKTLDEKETAALKKVSDSFAPKFRALGKWLENAPPPGRDQAKREAMLKSVDRALTHEQASKLDCTGEFFQSRMKAFLSEYLTTDPGGDTLVWKLYNHTEIIHTRDIRIVVDLIQGFDKITLSRDDLRTIVDNTDVLLLTHSHGDHADRRVVDMYIAAGRPVVAPKIFWKDYNRNDRITLIRDGTLLYPGARVRVYPAFQKEEENNVYLITGDNGVSVMHIGDNNNIFQAGREWFRRFKKPLQVDVLIPNIWSPDLVSLLKFVRPGVLYASHEHELGHPVEGRRSYAYVYGVLKAVGENSVVPAWGEYIRINGKKK